METIWLWIKKLNKEIDEFAPWKKLSDERKMFIIESLETLNNIAFHLQPFLPDTAEKILKGTKGKIKKIPILFPKH